MATSVWGIPEGNPWITSVMGIINRNMELAPPPAGSPGMFRCASPGLIQSVLERSGFKNVREQQVKGKVSYQDFKQFWEMMNEVAAPVVGALSKADEPMKAKIKNEIEELSSKYKTDSGLEYDFAAIVFSAEK